MPEGWRFRSGWRGKLILQRLHHWKAYDGYSFDSWDASDWLDATTEDIHEFLKEIQK